MQQDMQQSKEGMPAQVSSNYSGSELVRLPAGGGLRPIFQAGEGIPRTRVARREGCKPLFSPFADSKSPFEASPVVQVVPER